MTRLSQYTLRHSNDHLLPAMNCAGADIPCKLLSELFSLLLASVFIVTQCTRTPSRAIHWTDSTHDACGEAPIYYAQSILRLLVCISGGDAAGVLPIKAK